MSIMINGTEVTGVIVNKDGVQTDVTEVRVKTQGSTSYTVVFTSALPTPTSYRVDTLTEMMENEEYVDYGVVPFQDIDSLKESLFRNQKTIFYLFDPLNAHYNYNGAAFANDYPQVADVYKDATASTPLNFVPTAADGQAVYTTFQIVDAQLSTPSLEAYNNYTNLSFGFALRYGLTLRDNLFEIPADDVLQAFHRITDMVTDRGDDIIVIYLNDRMTPERLQYTLSKGFGAYVDTYGSAVDQQKRKIAVLLVGDKTITEFTNYQEIIGNAFAQSGIAENAGMDANLLSDYAQWNDTLTNILINPSSQLSHSQVYTIPIPATTSYVNAQGWVGWDSGEVDKYLYDTLGQIWSNGVSDFNKAIIRFDDNISSSLDGQVNQSFTMSTDPNYYVPPYIYDLIHVSTLAFELPAATLFVDELNYNYTNIDKLVGNFSTICFGLRLWPIFYSSLGGGGDTTGSNWNSLMRHIVRTERKRLNIPSDVTNEELLSYFSSMYGSIAEKITSINVKNCGDNYIVGLK